MQHECRSPNAIRSTRSESLWSARESVTANAGPRIGPTAIRRATSFAARGNSTTERPWTNGTATNATIGRDAFDAAAGSASGTALPSETPAGRIECLLRPQPRRRFEQGCYSRGQQGAEGSASISKSSASRTSSAMNRKAFITTIALALAAFVSRIRFPKKENGFCVVKYWSAPLGRWKSRKRRMTNPEQADADEWLRIRVQSVTLSQGEILESITPVWSTENYKSELSRLTVRMTA